MTRALVLHRGSVAVTAQEILDRYYAQESAPAATLSHVPIPHGKLAHLVCGSLEAHGIEIVNEQHAISHEGNRYFGLYTTNRGSTDFNLMVGLRNSHDKTFPAGVAIGSKVFVCDNLAFSSEIVVARKHTRWIMRDLVGKIDNAISQITVNAALQATQFDAFKATALDEDRARYLLTECVRRDILGCHQLLPALNRWTEPSHTDFAAPTVWRFFNAVTDVAKTWPIGKVLSKTRQLHALCTKEVGLETAV